ncbi:hypothetical protein LWI28_023007 [Acer negundo]|uniref:DUF538 domain-containing protein n=1 Tax=Acer negundo TaxID=4023 RepID=A0AAD5NUR4_ACENE|nr:hypothetical protein LWI28_023007 [Acer negundo]KAK4847933.1 hypothetical protein QYF36_007293 [Acer negundo]
MGLLTLLILISLITPFVAADSKSSVYQALQSYDFPVGVLPKGVTSYELNKDTGEFSVHMNKTCSFSIESYELKYKSTITGVISKDRLQKLKGVSVKVLLFWLNIVEVTRDGDELEFSVGIASADFSVNNFEECPQCGCGFNCNHEPDGSFSSS